MFKNGFLKDKWRIENGNGRKETEVRDEGSIVQGSRMSVYITYSTNIP